VSELTTFTMVVTVLLLFFIITTQTSPNAYAETFLSSFGSIGSGNGQLLVPTGIAIDGKSGASYVVDSNNFRVEKFDGFENFVLAFGSLGSGNGQFNPPNGPEGITVDNAGNLYVADFGNGRVQKFDSNGNFLSQLGSPGPGDGQFCQPDDIAVDNLGFIYVTDSCKGNVQKFDSSGNFVLKFSASATGITFDPISNAIFVADPFNDKIQKFSTSGNLLSEFGSPGSGDGQLNVPHGVVTDDSGNIYVADQNNNRIQKFDPGRNFLLQFGSVGSGNGEFAGPTYIAIINLACPGGGGIGGCFFNLFITDGANNRVQIFESSPGGGPPPAPIQDTTTTVTSSQNPSIAGQPVTLTTTVTVVARGSGTPTGTITFLDGLNPLGTELLDSTGHASITIPFLIPSTTLTHSITASYSGDDNFNTSTSAVLTQTVLTPAQAVNNLVNLANSIGAQSSSLSNAQKLLNDNNPSNDNAACGKLGAFINEVNANKKLSQDQKNLLIGQANAIKTAIGC